jgi:hypothetical protein
VAYLSSGVSKSDFLARLRLSLEDADTSSRPLPQSDPSTSATSHHDNQDPPAAREPEPETSVAEESTDNNVAATPPVSNATGKRPEKAKKHESQDTSSSEVSSRQDYVKQQRMREQAAKAERARILQRIRSDREEWKHKEQVQQGASAAPGKESTPRSESQRTTSLNQPRSTQQFRIQVRLFDGSTIRSTFSSDQTIGTDVRQWVDQQVASANVPYTLKQVLAPLPNRTISMSDEEESLRSLALGPSATLVMVPIQSYTNAYTGSEPGLVYRGISGGYGLVRSAVGSIYDGLSTFLGLGQTPSTSGSETQGNNSAGAPGSGFNDGAGSTSSGEGIKIRTLADQRRERGDQQFYNGNQVSPLIACWRPPERQI